jgi:IS5 family transposase
MIKYTSTKQIPIEDFILPFSGTLSKENRWVKLAYLLPWDEMAAVYVKNMSRKMGRKAVDPRVAIGTLLIRHIKRMTDEGTIEDIQENPYLQYFLGYPEYRYEQPFASSLFVSIRRRLSEHALEELTEHFMTQVHKIEQKIEAKKKEAGSGNDDSPAPDSKTGDSAEKKQDAADTKPENKGHLIVDATVAPSDIKYPTDLDLLNDSREKSEQLIDLLYVPEKGKIKPRTYRKKARKDYLCATKQRKKRKKTIRNAIKKQLGYVGRNLKTIEKLLDAKEIRAFPLAHKHQKTYWVIQELYRQQKQMYDDKTHKTADRIVSISQPHIRPIVRGKSGKEVEFGAKISISLVEGYSYPDRISWDAFNEGTDLIPQLKSYKNRFGYYPEWVSADNIYGNRENRAFMKKHNINYSGVALGRRPKELTQESKELEAERKKKGKQRSQVEGVFGVGKRKYDLDLVKARTKETSESWIGMVFLIMNIAQFMRVIFCAILKMCYFGIEKLKKSTLGGWVLPRFGIAKYKLATF